METFNLKEFTDNYYNNNNAFPTIFEIEEATGCNINVLQENLNFIPKIILDIKTTLTHFLNSNYNIHFSVVSPDETKEVYPTYKGIGNGLVLDYYCWPNSDYEMMKSSINDYINVRPKENIQYDSRDALFLSERRERISNRTVQYIVKQELLKAGLDINKYSVHKLRHTAATLMYKYGNVDIRALQELLGHASISTTEIYTHVDNEQVRNAVESNPLSDFS